MKKTCKSLIFLLLWGLWGFQNEVQAQSAQLLDSLNRLLKESIPDTNRVNILNELNTAYVYSNSDTAIHYAKQAISLARQLKFTRGESYALANISFSENEKRNYVSAIRYARLALEVANRGRHLPEQGRAYLRLGDVFRDLNYTEESLDFFKKAENIFLQLNNQERLIVVYNNIGVAYSSEAYLASEKAKKDSLRLLALAYYEKALAICRTVKKKNQIAIALRNIAEIYERIDKDSLALVYLDEGMSLMQELNNMRGIYNLKNIKAIILFKKGQIEEAEKLALELPVMDEKIHGKPTDSDTYKLLSDLYLLKKDYAKAYQYRVIYQEIRDKRLYNAEAIQAAQQLRKDLEAEKEEVMRQEAEKERQIQQLYWMLAGGFALLTLSILGLVYRNNLLQRQANHLLQEKNSEITQQAEEIHQQAEEIAALNSHLELQVEKRTRQLRKRNTQLSEYAFFNAHELRAPVATILGLYQLLELDISAEEREVVFQKICESVIHLDQMVMKSQQLLDKVGN